MIDLHAHVLPGLDDGVSSFEEARELAVAEREEGVEAIAATPHVRADYPTTPRQMEEGVQELRTQLVRHRVGVEILCGAEVDLALLPEIPHDDLVRFTLAQTGRYLLVEFPYRGLPVGLRAVIRRLRVRGITAVLAHPERNPRIQDRPTMLEEVVDAGALVQVTAASVSGRFGAAAKVAARTLLDRELAHVIATDAHGPGRRASALREAIDAIPDPALAARLTREVPAAIVAGADVPRRRA